MSDTSRALGSIWSGDKRQLTIASVIAVTGIALQGLAIGTIAPVIANDLHGQRLYGWLFNAFLIPQILATVVGGHEVDRRKPWQVMFPALILFMVGLLVCGLAQSMTVLILGRILVGFGTGAMYSAVFATISAVYDDRLRPSIFAAISSAWIIPSLVGPFVAGNVADHVNWHWVFLGMVPLSLAIAGLTWAPYHQVTLRKDMASGTGAATPLPTAILLAVGTFLFLVAADDWGVRAGRAVIGQHAPSVVASIPLAVLGLALMIPMLRRLMPGGTFSLQPMLGAAIGFRALGLGAFAVIETFLVYSLKTFGGLSSSQAGLMLTIGSLTWSAGSIFQARQEASHGPASRPRRIFSGITLMILAIGMIVAMPAFFGGMWWWIAGIAYLINGFGMGISNATTTAVAFAHAPEGKDGLVASATLLGDLFMNAIGVGIAAQMIPAAHDAGWSIEHGAALALSVGLALALLAWFAAFRLLRASSS